MEKVEGVGKMQYKNLEHFEKFHGKAFVYVLELLDRCLEGGQDEGLEKRPVQQ